MTFSDIQEKSRSVWEDFAASDRPRILVGMGTCDRAAGAASPSQTKESAK